MDLLGSIMQSMDKPPSLSEKEKLQLKKQREEFEKKQNEEKERLKRFKDRCEAKLISHFKDPKNIMLKFDVMDKIHRSIIHEVAESQELLSYAFGIDGVDRYIRVYRKENAPCDDELLARRRGEPWNEEIKQRLIRSRELEKLEVAEEPVKKPKEPNPNSNYKHKYAHIIGQDAALNARKTETNKSYGFVPSENKKDVRSIEQTMADIRAKRRKLNDENQKKTD